MYNIAYVYSISLMVPLNVTFHSALKKWLDCTSTLDHELVIKVKPWGPYIIVHEHSYRVISYVANTGILCMI